MRTYITEKISYVTLFAACLAYANPAAAFTFQDDPSSTWGGDASTTVIITDNVYTVHNLAAVNLTANPLAELDFVVPFVWPIGVPMDGLSNGDWHSDNVNGSGFSLTVHLSNPGVGYVQMGNLADLTGNHQLPLDSTCSTSPSCQNPPYPNETRSTDDLIPIISLGAFGANEVKHFDVSFTYNWGPGRPDNSPLSTQFVGFTVSPISPVPEPETYAMLLAGLGLLGFVGYRMKFEV